MNQAYVIEESSHEYRTGAYLILASPGASNTIEIGRLYQLNPPEVIIGTAKDAHIQIPSVDFSNHRARLYLHENTWCLENLELSTSTFLNNFINRDSQLNEGDFLQVGHTVFQFLTGIGLPSGIYEQMFRMNRIDSHTGAYNRLQFWNSLEDWMSFSHRHNHPLSLVMIDIDNFRVFNNDYGHLAGDAILRELAQRILKRLRKGDAFFRYGGEEFSLILPNTDKDNALKFIDQLLKVGQQEPIHFENEIFTVTFSAGVATLKEIIVSGSIKNMEDEKINFVRLADDRLRHAKKLGKNQSVG